MTKISTAKSQMPRITNKRSAEFAHSQFLGQNAGVTSMEQMSFVGMFAAESMLQAMAYGNFFGAMRKVLMRKVLNSA